MIWHTEMCDETIREEADKAGEPCVERMTEDHLPRM